jgi:HSP20 family molecular chaperone IbpA
VTTVRYRHSSVRYAVLLRFGEPRPFGDIWESDRLRLLVQARWRPDADVYESARTVEITVDLAGVDEDDFEVQLFEDALIVDGARPAPPCQDGGVYHAAGIRQGPFRVELPLPAPVDAGKISASYDRGLLRVSLPKRARTQ